MTGAEREVWRESARELCRLVAGMVAKVAPAGLGHWPEAWHMVEAPSGRFLDVLAEYEADPSEVTDAACRTAAEAVVAALAEAARRWREAGQPGARDTHPAGAA